MLTLFVPPALEESMVDWLLENDAISGFSTAEAYGHGGRKTGMSLLEQVTGRQRRIQFMIETNRTVAEQLLAELQRKFAGVGLHFVLQPVIAAGQL